LLAPLAGRIYDHLPQQNAVPLGGRPDEVRKMKRNLSVFAAMLCLSPGLLAQSPDSRLDHFAPGEDVSATFAWERGAQCTLSDSIGVVLRSNWQKRHWIKIAGKQVEFNGETNMSDGGWYQVFVGSDFTISLRLQRVLPEPAGSDGVRLTGEIVVTRSAQSKPYKVTGSCGA
jgi:hypothetical protein